MEELLREYFESDQLNSGDMPSVSYFAKALHLSPGYLSRLLKSLTGLSTKQFITDKVIDLAKEKLSATNLTVSQIAYLLGFELPQSFGKLFKGKTQLSPLQFVKLLIDYLSAAKKNPVQQGYLPTIVVNYNTFN